MTTYRPGHFARTLHRLLPAIVAAALVPAPARAELPAELVETTDQAMVACQDLGGEPRILDGYERTLDLNGDGQADFITDLAGIECIGAWSAFCGSGGCPVTTWLSEADGRHSRFDLGYLEGYRILEDAGTSLPRLRAFYHGTLCGEDRIGAEGCSRIWSFAGDVPETSPIETAEAETAPAADPPEAAAAETQPGTQPEPQAEPQPEPEAEPEAEPARPPEDLPEGWTLRDVPGSTPLALGSGAGNIASLAAFCLGGQPFLALTLHERPAEETLALELAFSQGAVSATATFESTAGGAYVVALAEGPLAARLAGRDRSVAARLGGSDEGIVSLKGSTRAVRAALASCHAF